MQIDIFDNVTNGLWSHLVLSGKGRGDSLYHLNNFLNQKLF